VFLTPGLAEGFQYLRKQSLQLASKMCFLAAQFNALLREDLWLSLARHANAMAARLADSVRDLPGLAITHPVQANAVFATLPGETIAGLHERFPFYVWDEAQNEVRWMCSWDTTEDDVDAFAEAVREALAAS
jgi:threonine aldolase